MKTTLYEALGIAPSASEEEVRAALRGHIRKYYTKTRDGRGNVEEALRFINHASRILSDPALRARYDYDLKLSAGSLDQRIAHVVDGAVGRRKRRGDRMGDARAGFAGAAPLAPVRGSHHAGLTEAVTSFRRSTSVAIVLSAMFGLLIAAAVVSVTPSDALVVAKQVLVWLTLVLVAMTLVYGVVHGLAWTHRRRALQASALVEVAPEITILNWRRQKSVFLGTNQPHEDASWIFQLRMAELERAKAGRTSEPRLWNRLGARFFDYALWGLFLALLLTEFNALGILSDGVAYWLAHPLVAPVLVTASWIPVETLLIAFAQTTPGKWLFGVYLQFSISDAYATRDQRTRLIRGFKRSLRVWWQGMGCGFPLLTPICIAVAYEEIAQKQETRWDFAQDCLVTHGPIGGLNTVTGVVGLAAMLWLYGVAWHPILAESIDHFRASVETSLHFVDRDAGRPATHAVATPNVTTRTQTVPASAVVPTRAVSSTVPLDPDLAVLFAARQARLATLKVEGPRMLRAQNWRRAGELCRSWADLELGSADAWRCLGEALQGQGYHREAVEAFRKAKQYDPDDPALERAIRRNQGGIVADFLRRHGR